MVTQLIVNQPTAGSNPASPATLAQRLRDLADLPDRDLIKNLRQMADELERPPEKAFRPFYDAVQHAVYMHSSPTMGRGFHEGQPGCIVYEPSMIFLASAIYTVLQEQGLIR